MSKKGFSLTELMVVVAIIGVLAAVGVPKMFGQTAKAKAAELTPAAMTYVKLQQAYFLEYKGIGSWKKIGYEAPGKGQTSNFKYTKGDIASSIKPQNMGEVFASGGRVGWEAENTVPLNECLMGNKWDVSISGSGESGLEFKTKLVQSQSSINCIALTGSGWTDN